LAGPATEPPDVSHLGSLHHLDAAGAVHGDTSCRPASNQRVALEEIEGPQLKRGAQRWHHREVILARDVAGPQRVPQHNILVLDPPVPPGPGGQAVVTGALHRA
jgi:hypothetical protein